MNIKIVYFACLIPCIWQLIVEEQLDALIELPLYKMIKEMYISVIIFDKNDYQELLNVISKKDVLNKIKLGVISYENTFEYPGIKTLYDISDYDDNTIILYFHSKGMTSKLPIIRKKLFDYTILNYQEYIDEFSKDKELDIAGFIPDQSGFIYFNFFWVRSNYIRSWCPYPKPDTNRFIWEVWTGKEYSTIPRKIKTWSPILNHDQIIEKNGEPWCSLFDLLNKS